MFKDNELQEEILSENGAEDFIPVQLFRCRYCDRIFKTKTHQCKFRPGNCFSCQNLVGIRTCFGLTESGEKYARRKEVICAKGREKSFLELWKNHWQMECPDFCLIPGFSGKKDYLNRLRDLRQDGYAEEDPGPYEENSEDEDPLPFH